MFLVDKGQARRCALHSEPPDNGPLEESPERIAAMLALCVGGLSGTLGQVEKKGVLRMVLAASFAWCHLYGHWPIAIYGGGDENARGRLCGFCRRPLEADETVHQLSKAQIAHYEHKGALRRCDEFPFGFRKHQAELVSADVEEEVDEYRLKPAEPRGDANQGVLEGAVCAWCVWRGKWILKNLPDSLRTITSTSVPSRTRLERIRWRCRSCNNTLHAPPNTPATKCRCPFCGDVQEVRKANRKAPDRQAFSRPGTTERNTVPLAKANNKSSIQSTTAEKGKSSPAVKGSCPNCRAALTIPPNLEGTLFRCAKCSSKLSNASWESAAARIKSLAGRAAEKGYKPDRVLEAYCASCGLAYSVEDQNFGYPAEMRHPSNVGIWVPVEGARLSIENSELSGCPNCRCRYALFRLNPRTFEQEFRSLCLSLEASSDELSRGFYDTEQGRLRPPRSFRRAGTLENLWRGVQLLLNEQGTLWMDCFDTIYLPNGDSFLIRKCPALQYSHDRRRATIIKCKESGFWFVVE